MLAEKAVLSRVLLSGEWSAVMDRRVTAELFQDEDCRRCFDFVSAFYAKYSKVPSVELIEEEFPNLELKHAKEPAEYYVDKMVENYVRVRGSRLLMDSARVLVDTPLIGIEELQAGIADLSNEAMPTRDSWLSESRDRRKERYLRLKSAGGMDGYPTPWEVLNEATLGMHAGEFFAIVSRPAVGKTFMLALFGEYAARNGLKVLFVSNEMSDEQISQRFDAVHFKLPYKELRAGLLPDALEQRYFEGLDNLTVDMVVTEEVHGLAALTAKVDKYTPDLLLVDGLYLMSDDIRGSSGWEKTSNVSRGIKKLARKKRIPIVATTQFNRAAEEVRWDKVTLANLGFSDSIGQDADVVLGLFRTQDMVQNDEMRVRMLKVREGEPKDFTLGWDLRRMEFPVLGTDDDDAYLPEDDIEEESIRY